MRFFIHGLIGALLTTGSGLLAGSAGGEANAGPSSSRLVVLVVFDQMRADYLTRWQKQFGEGGFKRLQEEGAWFQNCNYPYASTLTAPGHTSLVTGCCPDRHGIIGNDWYDRAAGKIVGAVESERYQPVPPVPEAKPPVLGCSPERRRQETVGDVLLRASAGKSKVVGLSIKDRAALLLAALRAQICYWFSASTGSFGTSTYYRQGLHPWVKEFNRSGVAERWFGKDWNRLRPDLDYNLLSGRDDVAAEGDGFKQGRTFPHPTSGGLNKPGKDYYNALTDSPFGNELLLALTRRALEAEKLGKGETPDLLLLSFSSNDLIGHTWGPDSQEVLDVTLRSDLIVKGLLAMLDAQVGRGRYTLVLSADHGVCPFPEVSWKQGKDSGRVPPKALLAEATKFLNETYARGEKLVWIEAAVDSWVYLNRGAIQACGVKAADVEATLARWLMNHGVVHGAYTRTQLSAGVIDANPISKKVLRSFDPDRSGDVYIVLKPNYLLSEPLSPKTYLRTTHGSPYEYDTHVPLLVYGPGIRPGIRSDAVTPLATAAILARALGVPAPPAAEDGVPAGLWK
jgi:predicted AlkP superfamily pyrophosphatase or phosphodiesterase